MDATLQLTACPEIIDSVSDFCYKWGINAGLSEKESLEFTLAADELITDVILFAYPDEIGSFSLTLQQSLTHVELIVHELGEPFDPDRHTYNFEKARKSGDFEGAGLKITKHFTDDFIFINRGRKGKEFRLTKLIHEPHIAETADPEEGVKSPGKKADKKDQSYTIRPIEKKDAEDIARLIFRTYGYTYPKEEMYFPKKIERAIAQKEKVGVIARTESGEAVGYFAVLKITDTNLAMVGEAVVSPPYRRRGIMTAMMKSLVEISIEKNFAGLYGYAVTPHPISQRVNHKYGFKSTALMLAESVGLKYKQLKEEFDQPVSVVLDFRPLAPRRNVQVYLPRPYRNILKEIYDSLGTRCKELKAADLELLHKSDIQIEIDYKDNTASLEVRQFGRDFYSVLRGIIKSLEAKNSNAIYIDLPLEDPLILNVIEKIRHMGFIFSGLIPLYHGNKDYLRMQKIYLEIDFNYIELYSDMAKRIKKIIRQEYHEYHEV